MIMLQFNIYATTCENLTLRKLRKLLYIIIILLYYYITILLYIIVTLLKLYTYIL